MDKWLSMSLISLISLTAAVGSGRVKTQDVISVAYNLNNYNSVAGV